MKLGQMLRDGGIEIRPAATPASPAAPASTPAPSASIAAAPTPPVRTPAPVITPTPLAPPPPAPVAPAAEPVPVATTPPQKTAVRSLYTSTPSAIYRAAEQLNIPIVQNRERVLGDARANLRLIFDEAVKDIPSPDGLWEQTIRVVNSLMTLVSLDPNFTKLLDLGYVDDDDVFYHSVNACIISIDIAKDVRKIELTTREIAAAALLHDIGSHFLGMRHDTCCNSDDKNHANHMARVQDILTSIHTPETVKTLIREHHTRCEKGAPQQPKGMLASQIVTLSCGFENITFGSFRDSLQPGTTHENYVQATVSQYRTQIDQDILKAFISLRGFYPDGTMVELTNRSICLVIKQNEGFPLRPVVQVIVDSAGNHPEDEKIINLRTNTALSIGRMVTET